MALKDFIDCRLFHPFTSFSEQNTKDPFSVSPKASKKLIVLPLNFPLTFSLTLFFPRTILSSFLSLSLSLFPSFVLFSFVVLWCVYAFLPFSLEQCKKLQLIFALDLSSRQMTYFTFLNWNTKQQFNSFKTKNT